MKLDYKGLRDRHLNVFCGYNAEHLENNVTKALINVIDSFDSSQKRKVLEKLTSLTFPNGELTTRLYLQSKPNKCDIEAVAISNRYILGISPTGKCWGYDRQDIHDEDKLKAEIINEWKAIEPDLDDSEYNKIANSVLNDIKSRRDTGSIPDAWIFIDINGKPSYLIILENKLYNLDPDQIYNHIEKSLGQTKSNLNEPLYKSFKEICKILNDFECYLSNQFIEYLTILGYLEIDSLPLACSADREIRKRVCFNPAKLIMKRIFIDGVDIRGSRQAVRKHLDKKGYLREINLCLNRCENKENPSIYLSLAICPTMSSAKYVYNNIDLPLTFSNKRIKNPYSSFHLGFANRGQNIRRSYLDGYEWEINDYIKYWKKNVDSLKIMSTIEGSSFVEKLGKEGKYSLDQADKLANYLKTKKNPILVIPEIIYEIEWSCDEIASMKSNDEFIEELISNLKEFLTKIKCHIPNFN